MSLQDAIDSAITIRANGGECGSVDCSKCFRRTSCHGDDFLEHDYKAINLYAAECFLAAQKKNASIREEIEYSPDETDNTPGSDECQKTGTTGY